jgi:hypothetical protein
MSVSARSFLCIAAALAIAACVASPARLTPTGEVSADGLQRLSGGSFDELWVRPGLDLAAYRELLLESTSVSYRDVGERTGGELTRPRSTRDGFAIPLELRERIEASFRLRVAEALDESASYRRVESPGPGVLQAQVGLVDFVSTAPPDEPQARAWVSSVGHATLVIELYDSVSKHLLVRASKHARAGPHAYQLIQANAVRSWSELDRQMIRWGNETRGLLEQLYAQKL